MSLVIPLGKCIREVLALPDVSRNSCWSNLVPNVCRSAVFRSGSVEGIAQSVLWAAYRVVNWTGSWRKQAFNGVLRGEEYSWRISLQTIRKVQETFALSLENCFRENLLVLPISEDYCEKLNQWHYFVYQAFEESLGASLAEKVYKLQAAFRNCLGSDVEAFPEDIIELLTNIELSFNIIKVKTRLKQELPFIALQKIAKREDLEGLELHAWNQFVKRIAHVCMKQEAHKRLTIANLHKCIVTLVTHMEIGASVESLSRAVGRVEWQLNEGLLKLGCAVFQESDPIHIAKVNRMGYTVGAQIICERISYRVDAEIRGSHPPANDLHRVFSLQNNEDLVLVTGAFNQTELLIERENSEISREFEMSLFVARVFEVDVNGFGLVQKLPGDTMESYSLACDSNASRRYGRMQSLIALIKNFIAKDKMPRNMTRMGMHFIDNQIFLARHTSSVPLNWNVLAQLVRDSLASTPVIYQYVMTQSGLSNHSVPKFYERVLQYIADGKEDQLEDMFAHTEFKDPLQKDPILAIARNLKDEVACIFMRCKNEIMQRGYIIKDQLKEGFDAALKRASAAALQDNLIFSKPFLVDDDEVVSTVVHFIKPPLQEERFQELVFAKFSNMHKEGLFGGLPPEAISTRISDELQIYNKAQREIITAGCMRYFMLQPSAESAQLAITSGEQLLHWQP